MDAPIAPPTDPEKDNPGKTEPMQVINLKF